MGARTKKPDGTSAQAVGPRSPQGLVSPAVGFEDQIELIKTFGESAVLTSWALRPSSTSLHIRKSGRRPRAIDLESIPSVSLDDADFDIHPRGDPELAADEFPVGEQPQWSMKIDLASPNPGVVFHLAHPPEAGSGRSGRPQPLALLFDQVIESAREQVALKRKIEGLEREAEDGRQERARLAEQLALARKEQFGASSERFEPDAATDVASTLTLTGVPPECEAATAPQKRLRLVSSGAGRKPLPESLLRDEVHHRLNESERICANCDKELIELKPEVTEQLISIPQHVRVRKNVIHKYYCRCCNRFCSAAAPKSILPGSSYGSPEFLAQVAVNKYQFGMPTYRQQQMFEAQGAPLNTTTLSNLMIGVAHAADGLKQRLLDGLLRQPAIYGDETGFQVLKEPGREPETLSYLWVLRSNALAVQQIVFCEYRPTRAGSNVKELLTLPDGTAFSGLLQVDGYAGYNQMEQSAILVACMAHIRRKFHEAFAILPVEQRGSAVAAEVIDMIKELYEVEKRAKGRPPDEILQLRRDHARPIFENIKRWLDANALRVLPKTPLGRAIRYALDQWDRMEHYLDDPQAAIDNNIIEREIKQFVIGRKAWLFANSQEGARASATLYSLVLTARANGVDPYKYLVTALRRLPYAKTADELDALMPWALKEELVPAVGSQALAA